MSKDLAPFTRYRVIYTDPDTGRQKSQVTLAGRAPDMSMMLGYQILVFDDQANGDVNIISLDLVQEVVMERQDRTYGTWHKVGVWR